MESIKELNNEIQKCMDNNQIYPALFMSLTIPDACGSIKYPELKGSNFTGARYKKWFLAYVDPILNPLSYTKFGKPDDDYSFNSEVCYKLRCSLLHSAELDIGEDIKFDDFDIDFSPGVEGVLFRSDDKLMPVREGDLVTYKIKKIMRVRAYYLIKCILDSCNNFIKELESK